MNSHSPSPPAWTLLPIVWGETKELEFVEALLVTEDLASLGSIALVFGVERGAQKGKWY